MHRIAAIITGLVIAVVPLLAPSPATAGRGSFPHPPTGPIRCIQAPCPQLPNPTPRDDFPHPGGGVKCFRAPCPRIPA